MALFKRKAGTAHVQGGKLESDILHRQARDLFRDAEMFINQANKDANQAMAYSDEIKALQSAGLESMTDALGGMVARLRVSAKEKLKEAKSLQRKATRLSKQAVKLAKTGR